MADPNLPTDDKSGAVIGLVASLLPLTTIVVGLRLYTRRYYGNGIGADDWTTLLSLIVTIVGGAIICVMTTKGLGHHIWNVPESRIPEYFAVFYQFIVFYDVGLGVVKLAILLQYLRVFSIKMRKVTIWVIVITSMWNVALVLRSIFSCVPVQGFWDKTIQATCLPAYPRWYIDAAGNIVTDIVIFALPIPVLWKLHLPRSQRISLIGIFCLGFFTCAISVIRIRFLKFSDDETYDNAAAASWSLGELCCGIVCSSLGTLRPLFFRLIEAPLRQYRSTVGHSGGRSGAGLSGKYHHTSSGSRSAVRQEPAVELSDRDAASRRRSAMLGRGGDADALGKAVTWLAGESDESLDLERQQRQDKDDVSLVTSPTPDRELAEPGLPASHVAGLSIMPTVSRSTLRQGTRAEGDREHSDLDSLPLQDDRGGLPRTGTVTVIQAARLPAAGHRGRAAAGGGFGVQVQREFKVAQYVTSSPGSRG